MHADVCNDTGGSGSSEFPINISYVRERDECPVAKYSTKILKLDTRSKLMSGV